MSSLSWQSPKFDVSCHLRVADRLLVHPYGEKSIETIVEMKGGLQVIARLFVLRSRSYN
jgi:hypothetical protein